MFKKLFGIKTNKEVSILSPLNGKLIRLEDVPDRVFAEKMLGDGIAIEPTEGILFAPVSGSVAQIFPTKHAVGLRTDHGLEILIHIGLETVHMNGEGFEAHVKEGDRVEVGQSLITFSIDLIKEKAKSIVTPIVITNGEVVENIVVEAIDKNISAQETIMTIKMK